MCFIRINNKCALLETVFEVNSDIILKTHALVKRWQDGEEIKTKRSGRRNSYADRERVSPLNSEVPYTIAQQPTDKHN